MHLARRLLVLIVLLAATGALPRANAAEFYTEDQKIVLREGRPKMVDINGNQTEGDELTYYANDDRLLVNGSAAQPVRSYVKPAAKKTSK